ncbi:hypothetical protein [Streptomyces sp. NPDC001282]|uniref:hypothetical protein n=1 Tax=Streptomyces sp. NPDC001282 TaxID=3364557 RepID=UPI0036C8A52D
MSALIPPHRQYRTPVITRFEIEWQLARSRARSIVGDDLPNLAARVGMTPDEALDHLAAAPRWVLEPEEGAA